MLGAQGLLITLIIYHQILTTLSLILETLRLQGSLLEQQFWRLQVAQPPENI